ncbi:hypothetical protein M1M11_03605 [Pseudomonas azerbaijanoccidens]|uniref:hypothetical protein n=1 Tax=Pseudomonas azerbaijanoccidentalis TaxID=2842347 RepID=UPI00200A881D|nr:hypothetical protein [Pseudomonas azerbaijanoccidentalis]MCK8663964.1 hypothetical protein [Pseudomonas azerbaijanoccidentalis]
MKHDLSLHTEVAAEKKTLVRALAGDESARRWREKGADDGIESVHDQNLIIIFMRQGGGISCSESPVTFGGEIL